ncbi:hypothetical protein NEF87_002441 [Candidatus Lokiarchaeum ossiferum]|uniref:Aspartate kinase n=1 Tax=Candidatus Lokiarchaeum ossiferum TaxID=2951803 RepID=A0ABY6HUB1_9ARCH|nr:hypothetical protein NEF87_002441 [Candidatus Lokiarchaeum sp. B-35]
MGKLSLIILPETYAICRLSPHENIPKPKNQDHFFSVTQTNQEISVVLDERDVSPDCSTVELGWRCLKIDGPLYFSLIGILASIAVPLAEAKVSIFTISTFDTDYLLVKSRDLQKAKEALNKAGFNINH